MDKINLEMSDATSLTLWVSVEKEIEEKGNLQNYKNDLINKGEYDKYIGMFKKYGLESLLEKL